MKRPKSNLTAFLLMALAAGLFVSTPVAMAAGGHAYVGESKCEDCHDSQHEKLDIIGPDGTKSDPVSVWMKDPHHKAFDSLTSDWGKQAAQKASVTDPQAEGAMCLNCHATGTGGNNPPDPSEGVSCEACHGAAADYVARDKHGEIGNDPAKMQAAVALGLIDMRKIDVREQNCRAVTSSIPPSGPAIARARSPSTSTTIRNSGIGEITFRRSDSSI